jgi:hypothetical protein
MIEQLALLPDAPARLTDRQAAVLHGLQAAGTDGLDTDQAGAIAHELKEGRWAHSRDARCAYCARDGKTILQRLAQLGHARYRRANRARSVPGTWLATNQTTDPADDTSLPPGMTDTIPY